MTRLSQRMCPVPFAGASIACSLGGSSTSSVFSVVMVGVARQCPSTSGRPAVMEYLEDMRALLAPARDAACVREPPVATLRWHCGRRALLAAISLFGAVSLIISSGCYTIRDPEAADPEAAAYFIMDYPNLVGFRLVGDPARPGEESAALAGSCIDTGGEFALDLQQAARLQWATGAEVQVEINWIRPCGCSFFGRCTKCGPLVEQVSELDPAIKHRFPRQHRSGGDFAAPTARERARDPGSGAAR